MTKLDIDAGTVVRMYDDFQAYQPRQTAAVTETVRLERPGLPWIIVRRRVVGLLLSDDRRRYQAARKVFSTPRPEPTRSSPLEQVKGLTSILNPRGERTGGMYRASF